MSFLLADADYVTELLDDTAEDALPVGMSMVARCQVVIVRRRETRSDITNLIHRPHDTPNPRSGRPSPRPHRLRRNSGTAPRIGAPESALAHGGP